MKAAYVVGGNSIFRSGLRLITSPRFNDVLMNAITIVQFYHCFFKGKDLLIPFDMGFANYNFTLTQSILDAIHFKVRREEPFFQVSEADKGVPKVKF